jgi:predicted DNA-binding protein
MSDQGPQREKSQRVVVTLPYSMYEAIKALADKNRRPMAEEIRISIENRLNKIEKEEDAGQRVAVVAT